MSDKNELTQKELFEIVKAEFDYISSTAIQAGEDRARVSEFYLISIGSSVAAIFSTNFKSVDSSLFAYLFLFVLVHS